MKTSETKVSPNKRIWNLSLSHIAFLAAFMLSCCNSGQNVQTWNYKQCTFDGSEAKQTQHGLSVELEPLNAGSFYKYPELFKFDHQKVPQILSNANEIYSESRGGRWIHTFCFGENFLVGMKLKIINNTGHVLNLSGTLMYLKNEEGDSIMAVTVIGDPTMVEVETGAGGLQGKEGIWRPLSYLWKDGSLISTITHYEEEYEKTRSRNDLPYPVGIAAEVVRQNINDYKLIGDVNLDILPGTDFSGILFFPTLLSDQKFTVKLYNLVVMTDSGGKTVRKTNFDFRFIPEMGKVWLDQNKMLWIEGDPPAPTEYFDKSQHKWIMRGAKK